MYSTTGSVNVLDYFQKDTFMENLRQIFPKASDIETFCVTEMTKCAILYACRKIEMDSTKLLKGLKKIENDSTERIRKIDKDWFEAMRKADVKNAAMKKRLSSVTHR